MLKVQLLTPEANPPTLAHPGEDIAYDLYSSESIVIPSKGNGVVKTGIAIEFTNRMGGLIKERSSVAKKRVIAVGGVIDAGYRGELIVRLENLGDERFFIEKGDRVAQLIPQFVLTAGEILVVDTLSASSRGVSGFGSSGK